MPVFYNNRLYVAGGGDIWWGKNEAWLKCLDATGTGDITTNGLVWSYPLQKHVLSTPAVYHGLVFIADIGHTLHCVDADTGKPYWTHELQGEAWASPLVADGKVYLGTRSGAFYIFAASKEKKVLSTIDLGHPISSTAIAANGVLYLATMTHLYALRQGAGRNNAFPLAGRHDTGLPHQHQANRSATRRMGVIAESSSFRTGVVIPTGTACCNNCGNGNPAFIVGSKRS